MYESIISLATRQQKDGLENLTIAEIERLKIYYTNSLPYKQGLDRLATQIDLQKIYKILENE